MNPLQMAINELRASFARATGNRGMQTQQPNQYIQPMVQRPDGSWYNPALPENSPTPPSFPNPRGYPNMEQMPVQIPGSPPGLPNVAPWGERAPNMEQMPVLLPDPPMNTTRPRVAPWGEQYPNMEQMPYQVPGAPPSLPSAPPWNSYPVQDGRGYSTRRVGRDSIDWSKLRR